MRFIFDSTVCINIVITLGKYGVYIAIKNRYILDRQLLYHVVIFYLDDTIALA